jgi:4-hydroxy-4-methyl-2-oxoglutarate aldolase
MTELGVVHRSIKRADRALVDKLTSLGVATVHEAMGRIGLMKPYCGRSIRARRSAARR